jgi:hypothetical protein
LPIQLRLGIIENRGFGLDFQEIIGCRGDRLRPAVSVFEQCWPLICAWIVCAARLAMEAFGRGFVSMRERTRAAW